MTFKDLSPLSLQEVQEVSSKHWYKYCVALIKGCMKMIIPLIWPCNVLNNKGMLVQTKGSSCICRKVPATNDSLCAWSPLLKYRTPVQVILSLSKKPSEAGNTTLQLPFTEESCLHLWLSLTYTNKAKQKWFFYRISYESIDILCLLCCCDIEHKGWK